MIFIIIFLQLANLKALKIQSSLKYFIFLLLVASHLIMNVQIHTYEKNTAFRPLKLSFISFIFLVSWSVNQANQDS